MRLAHLILYLCSLIASAVSAAISYCVSVARDFFVDEVHLDARTRLLVDQQRHESSVSTALLRFKAFAARVIEHDRFSAGQFGLGRSSAV